MSQDEKQTSHFVALMNEGKYTSSDYIRIFLVVIALGLTLYHLMPPIFGYIDPLSFRSVSLSFFLTLVFLIKPMGVDYKNKKITWLFAIDLFCILLSILVNVYILYDIDEFVMREGDPTRMDVYMGTAIVLLIMEATRRTMGWAIVILTGFFLAQALYADHMFSIFYGPPLTLDQLMNALFLELGGIYGIAMEVMSSYLFLFIFFGALLMKTGVGQFFTQLAYSLTGHLVGGPAKASVVASALMGSISGSAVANVVTTGSVTIPMMKKVGYTPTFAGGVEAVASSGGQMMPPVMGIAAFLIANIVGIPYSHLALKALFPASLFFFSIFLMVDFEARKRKLKTIPRDALPSFKEAFRKGGYFVIPLVVIVGILIAGYSPIKAALWGIICVIVLIFFNKETRPNPVKIVGVFEEGAVAAATIAPAAACAGILITAIFHSGIGLKFSNMIMVIAGNSLFVALVLSAVGAMILGMGMPTFFVYMTLYALILPGLINLGAEPLSIHMFVFYYGVISCITPPVAFAAFAASTVADSPPMRTGFYACYIGMAKYLVPFMFVFNPELLLIGETSSIVFVLISSLLGITALTAASSGYLFRQTGVIERILLLAATAALISPDLKTDLAGYILLGLVVFIQLIWKRTPVAMTEAAGSSKMTD